MVADCLARIQVCTVEPREERGTGRAHGTAVARTAPPKHGTTYT